MKAISIKSSWIKFYKNYDTPFNEPLTNCNCGLREFYKNCFHFVKNSNRNAAHVTFKPQPAVTTVVQSVCLSCSLIQIVHCIALPVQKL